MSRFRKCVALRSACHIMLWFRQRIFLRRAARGRKLGSEGFTVTFQLDPQITKEWEWFRTLIRVVGGLSQPGCFDQFYWIITINVGFFLESAHSRSSNASSPIDDLHRRNCQTQRWFWLMLTTTSWLFHSNVLQIRLYSLIPEYLLTLTRARHWHISCCFNY